MEEIEKIIDIEKEFRSSKSRFFRSVPGFVIKLVRKLVDEDGMNETIHRSRHLEGSPFIDDVLKNWNVELIVRGEKMPAEGRYICVANHPVGAIDALSFLAVLCKNYKDVISPSNEMLGLIPNLRPLMLGINVFGKNSKETAAALEELFRSGTQVMIFPSGEVSRRQKGVISDPEWHKTFVTKAIQHRRDIIPVHITGKNSGLFYFVANLRKKLGIKMYLETILLPREMMNQRNHPITLTIGKPVPYQSLTPEKSHSEWALTIKDLVYKLGSDQDQQAR
jgi:1-acyl-sn-glycerol-3-phosphate acyltransferase